MQASSRRGSCMLAAICKQGVRGSSPLSSTRQNTPILILDRGGRAINVPSARPRQHSGRALTRRSRYLDIGQRLPGLLDELHTALAEASDDDRPHLYALLAQAYGPGSSLAHQLGYLDLRALALDRVEWAARQTGDLLRIARTQWSRGASLRSALTRILRAARGSGRGGLET
jgi:hypothetical protein